MYISILQSGLQWHDFVRGRDLNVGRRNPAEVGGREPGPVGASTLTGVVVGGFDTISTISQPTAQSDTFNQRRPGSTGSTGAKDQRAVLRSGWWPYLVRAL